MIPQTCAGMAADLARRGFAGAGLARILVTVVETAPRAARPAPRPRPRPLAGGLTALLAPDGPVRDPGAARAAAAAFSAGDGFLPGQLIDRTI